MREKTYSNAEPSKWSVLNGEHLASVILRDNIEQEDETWSWDEYEMEVPKSKNLESKVEADFDEWLARAKYQDEKKAEADVRAIRNDLLAESDAMMISDRPSDKEAWATYRQALRDITKQAGFPYDVEFPAKP